MTNANRYYLRIEKQWRGLVYIGVMFIVTVVYALGLKNREIGQFLLLMSLVYPCVVLMIVFGSLRRMNHIDLKSDGIHVKSWWHSKLIRWSTIARIDRTALGGNTVLAIDFNDTYGERSWQMRFSRRFYGCDGLLPDAYRADGLSLYEGLEEWHKKHFRQSS